MKPERSAFGFCCFGFLCYVFTELVRQPAAGGTGSIEKKQVGKTVKQKEMAPGGTGSAEKNQLSKHVKLKKVPR